MSQQQIMAAAAEHLVVVCYPAQGHINPARHLALRLLRATGARVTVCTAASACRRMFPDAAEAEEHVDSAGVRYVPYPDGDMDQADYLAQLSLVGPRALAAALDRLRDAGTPATLVMYTVLLSWVPAVARGHGVPAALYWIQSATTLAVYVHFLRGADDTNRAVADDPLVTVRVPGIPAPLHPRDLPSFLLTTANTATDALVLAAFRELLDALGREHRPTVLANTFDAMEPEAVAALREQHGLDVVPVGPFLDAAPGGGGDLFRPDGKGYLEWLDARPAGSVVYISFGSTSVMSRRQIEEMERGMAESGRPFLWVLRKDNPGGGAGEIDAGAGGMVVEWCDQGKVLSHPAVGCFVTHCGWNSTLESVASGVPVVAVPQWTDQGTNAWLVEQLGTGVRAVVNDKDGVLEAGELRRCLAFAASEMVRAKAELWRKRAREAVAAADSTLRAALSPPSGRAVEEESCGGSS